MVRMETSDSAAVELPQSDHYTVTLRGRDYPLVQSAKTVEPAVEPTVVSAEQDRNTKLEQSIWDELPFAWLSSDGEDRNDIVRAYSESLTQLRQYKEDVKGMFRTMCEVNLQFRCNGRLRKKLRDEALRKKKTAMLERGNFQLPLKDDWLTAPNVAQPPELLLIALGEALRKTTTTFVRAFFAALDRFVSADTVGLIEWYDSDICMFHFFGETVDQEELSYHRQEGQQHRGQRVNRDMVATRQTVTHETRGAHHYTSARHEHHLIGATAHFPGEELLPVPQPAVRLLEAIPDWLMPLVRIVEGDRIRERVIERDEGSEEWCETYVETVHGKVYDPVPRPKRPPRPKPAKRGRVRRDRVTYDPDPAIVLDRYVLTGWGNAEIEAEEQRRMIVRRQQEQQAEQVAHERWVIQADWRFWFAAVSSALLFAVATATTILATVTPSLVVVAPIFGLAALGASIYGLSQFLVWKRRRPQWRFCAHCLGAVAGLIAGLPLLLYGLLAPLKELGAVGLLCLFLGAACASEIKRFYGRLPDNPW